MPRMAIDAAGVVYLTNGASAGGRLYAFDAALDLVWSESVPQVNLGGPILGDGGILVVCGTGTNIRAYRTTDPAGLVQGQPDAAGELLLSSHPNPFVAGTTISFETPASGPVSLVVLDATGRLVRRLAAGAASGTRTHQIRWDGMDGGGRPVPAGLYLARLQTGGASTTLKLIVAR